MKIYVAGATGAVGRPLVRTLCTLGHEVTDISANEHVGSSRLLANELARRESLA